MVDWNEFLKRGHQAANIVGYQALNAANTGTQDAYRWLDAKVPQIPIVGQAYQGLSQLGDPKAKKRREDEIKRAAEATKIYDASKVDNSGLAKSQFTNNTGNLVGFAPSVAGLAMKGASWISDQASPAIKGFGADVKNKTKKKPTEKGFGADIKQGLGELAGNAIQGYGNIIEGVGNVQKSIGEKASNIGENVTRNVSNLAYGMITPSDEDMELLKSHMSPKAYEALTILKDLNMSKENDPRRKGLLSSYNKLIGADSNPIKEVAKSADKPKEGALNLPDEVKKAYYKLNTQKLGNELAHKVQSGEVSKEEAIKQFREAYGIKGFDELGQELTRDPAAIVDAVGLAKGAVNLGKKGIQELAKTGIKSSVGSPRLPKLLKGEFPRQQIGTLEDFFLRPEKPKTPGVVDLTESSLSYQRAIEDLQKQALQEGNPRSALTIPELPNKGNTMNTGEDYNRGRTSPENIFNGNSLIHQAPIPEALPKQTPNLSPNLSYNLPIEEANLRAGVTDSELFKNLPAQQMSQEAPMIPEVYPKYGADTINFKKQVNTSEGKIKLNPLNEATKKRQAVIKTPEIQQDLTQTVTPTQNTVQDPIQEAIQKNLPPDFEPLPTDLNTIKQKSGLVGKPSMVILPDDSVVHLDPFEKQLYDIGSMVTSSKKNNARGALEAVDDLGNPNTKNISSAVQAMQMKANGMTDVLAKKLGLVGNGAKGHAYQTATDTGFGPNQDLSLKKIAAYVYNTVNRHKTAPPDSVMNRVSQLMEEYNKYASRAGRNVGSVQSLGDFKTPEAYTQAIVDNYKGKAQPIDMSLKSNAPDNVRWMNAQSATTTTPPPQLATKKYDMGEMQKTLQVLANEMPETERVLANNVNLNAPKNVTEYGESLGRTAVFPESSAITSLPTSDGAIAGHEGLHQMYANLEVDAIRNLEDKMEMLLTHEKGINDFAKLLKGRGYENPDTYLDEIIAHSSEILYGDPTHLDPIRRAEYDEVKAILDGNPDLRDDIDDIIKDIYRKSEEQDASLFKVGNRSKEDKEIEAELRNILENYQFDMPQEVRDRMTGSGQINPDTRGIRPGQTPGYWMRSQDELDLENKYPPMSISDFNKDIEEAVRDSKNKLKNNNSLLM